jgi:TrwC relaxase
MIWQAVRAGFDYFQREAGYTRTGSRNTRVHGRESGQWRQADLVVAHWLQHTSRDGDMQLHVHSQIAHLARAVTDGRWRSPDSLGYNEHIGAVAAIVSQHLEEALTARLGVVWEARDDGHGFEIKGISGEMMRLFSSRRQSITADLRARAARFEQQDGRAPSQRELARLAQASNFATRAAKHGALDGRVLGITPSQSAETAPAREQRYRDLLWAHLPPGYQREAGHQAKWLWRTLHAAELADLDAGQVLAEAIGERDLAGSRDLASVIDARLRYRIGLPVPLPAGPRSAQIPATADPERRAYLTQIAALMDARKERIGEQAAEHELRWAVGALGPVPAHPLDRLAAAHRTFADRLAERQSLMIPSQDPDYGDLGQAFPAWTGPGHEPILRPPKPDIRPSPQILLPAADRDADLEAAD